MVEPNYRLFGSEPVLSRILLSEVLQHTPGLHLVEHIAIRDRFIRGMEEVVEEAQASGEILSTEIPQRCDGGYRPRRTRSGAPGCATLRRF